MDDSSLISCPECGQITSSVEGYLCPECQIKPQDKTTVQSDQQENNGESEKNGDTDIEDAEPLEFVVPPELRENILRAVDNNPTYRDESDFIYSAIRSELRKEKHD